MKEREVAVLNYRDMKTIRKMMSAVSADVKDYNRSKSWGVAREIEEIKQRLQTLRKVIGDRSGDPLHVAKNFKVNAEKNIKQAITKLCEKRKFNETVIVGGRETGTCEYKAAINKYNKPTVTLVVGHMWLRNVWKNIYKDGNQLTHGEYIFLSAIEYRTNVSHIRLYEAVAYGIKEKAQVNGWIGQSKLGGLAAFRLDKATAIQAAQRLTLGSVNEQISGETNG